MLELKLAERGKHRGRENFCYCFPSNGQEKEKQRRECLRDFLLCFRVAMTNRERVILRSFSYYFAYTQPRERGRERHREIEKVRALSNYSSKK
jgi:hypothetical protein